MLDYLCGVRMEYRIFIETMFGFCSDFVKVGLSPELLLEWLCFEACIGFCEQKMDRVRIGQNILSDYVFEKLLRKSFSLI